ncbi:serine/threonine-protein kinase [Streptomyces spectabilis]|uniref:serine/threonine-protein kinase n=1 Tax=Streptomyces spectabilis TaxID=68270 RepID=UPI0033FEAC91
MRGAILGGRYQLREPLGSGGMGTVWRAMDQMRHRVVAVKTVIVAAGTADSDAARRFQREIRVAALLRHPHIVEMHDFGEAVVDQRPLLYLVMEEIPGEPLNRLLDGRRPALAEVARWGGEICAALAAMHGVGIVHRDLKPANVMIGPDGRATVLDFGIARLDRDSVDLTTLTHTGHVVGTFAYMSPEQARGAALDARSDLYSLGCLLYATLTGRPPFAEGPWQRILRQHLDEVPPPPSAGRAGLPAAWDALLGDLLAKRPDDRPPDAAAAGAMIAELPAPEDPPEPPEPPEPPTAPVPPVHPPTAIDPDAANATLAATALAPYEPPGVLSGDEVISSALSARQLLALGGLVTLLIGALVALVLVVSGRDTGQSVGTSGLITLGGIGAAVGGSLLYNGYWDDWRPRLERRRSERAVDAGRKVDAAYRATVAQVSEAVESGAQLWVCYEYNGRNVWIHLYQLHFADGDLVGLTVNSGQVWRIAEHSLRAASASPPAGV